MEWNGIEIRDAEDVLKCLRQGAKPRHLLRHCGDELLPLLVDALDTDREGLHGCLSRLIEAAGCPDEDNFTQVVARVKAHHDAVLGTHRAVTPTEGGADMCGDCGVDIEDAVEDGTLCPAYGKREDRVTLEAVEMLIGFPAEHPESFDLASLRTTVRAAHRLLGLRLKI